MALCADEHHDGRRVPAVRPAARCPVGRRRPGRARTRAGRLAARARHLRLHGPVRASPGEGEARRRGADPADQPLLLGTDRHRGALRRRRAQVPRGRAPDGVRGRRTRSAGGLCCAGDAEVRRRGRSRRRVERRPRGALHVRGTRLRPVPLLSRRSAPRRAARVRPLRFPDAGARGRGGEGRGARLAAHGRRARGFRGPASGTEPSSYARTRATPSCRLSPTSPTSRRTSSRGSCLRRCACRSRRTPSRRSTAE